MSSSQDIAQAQSKFVYVTYIDTTPEQLWDALTDEPFTQQYWGKRIESDWRVGSSVKPLESNSDSNDADGNDADGNDADNNASDNNAGNDANDQTGEVLESDPPYRLAYTFQSPGSAPYPSRVVFELQPIGSIVKLILIHDNLDPQGFMAISRGWSACLSSLKYSLERKLLVLAA